MNKAENLLNSLTAYKISYNNEYHVNVNPDRTITVPDILKSIAVQYDNNVETITFDCPRYWDGNDFNNMNVYINYMRSDGHKGSYAVKNLVVDKNDNTMIHFDWTITEDVTMVSGKVSFLICIKNNAADTKPHWNSHINQDLVVAKGMEVYDVVVENSPDVIEEILAKLDTMEKERTHWVETFKGNEIMPEVYLETIGSGNFIVDTTPLDLVADETYIVNWNGVEYVSTATDATWLVGDQAVLLVNDGANIETSENVVFTITYNVNNNVLELRDAKDAIKLSVSIYKCDKVIHKIPDIFIPDSIATKDYVHTYVSEQLGYEVDEQAEIMDHIMSVLTTKLI